MAEILFKDESYAIIGACMKVHSELGPGFLEAVYQEALEREFQKKGIPYIRHHKLRIYFDGEKLDKFYVADFYCYQSIVLELKVCSIFCNDHFLQLRNYLKATKSSLGILINFGTTSLKYKRVINPSY